MNLSDVDRVDRVVESCLLINKKLDQRRLIHSLPRHATSEDSANASVQGEMFGRYQYMKSQYR